MKPNLFIFSLFIMFSSSTLLAQKSVKPLPEEVQRHFMIVQMSGFTRDELVDGRTEIDLTILPKAGIYVYSDTTYITAKMTTKTIQFFIKNKYTKTQDKKGAAIKAKLTKPLPLINRYRMSGPFIYFYSDKKLLIKAIAEDWD